MGLSQGRAVVFSILDLALALYGEGGLKSAYVQSFFLGSLICRFFVEHLGDKLIRPCIIFGSVSE